MHCTSIYPTQNEDVNLNRMVSMKNHFKKPIGFSDHSVGPNAAIQALSMGAMVFEKHFTLDNNLKGPDHWFSLNPDQFKSYVDEIHDAQKNGKSFDTAC